MQIYDRMIEARDSVPMSQAQWNAVDSVMRGFLNESRGPWAALRSNYDVSRGQNAIDRIQVLIDLYFPAGRPTETPVTPIAAKVIAFSEPNFTGTSWELGEGLYQVAQLNAGPIGNDNISSILIPEGHQIRIAQWQDNGGHRATYTDSIADLGILEDDVSRVQVISLLDYQEAIGESDTISLTDAWETVTLSRSYEDPVVIAGVPTLNGTDPSTARIRNVTSNSFEIQMDDWDYLGAAHSTELVSYMVIESGRYKLDDGTIVVAGNQTGQTHAWQTYDLGTAFDGLDTPLVLANVVTRNDAQAVTARVQVNSNSQFQVRLQEQESSDGVHFAETLSYFAIESGAGATGGLHYDAGTVAAGHTGQYASFDPALKLSSISSFFAAMQTFNGSDTASLRRTVLNAAGTNVFVDEEQSGDSEVSHGDETIAFFAIDRGEILGSLAQIQDLHVNIGGTVAVTEYDQMLTGADSVTGALSISLNDSFVPTHADTFNVVISESNLLGQFDNAVDGQRISTTGGEGTFLVTYGNTSNQIVLSSFEWSLVDFGDAPASYSTLRADDGARHASVGPQLGSGRDSEAEGVPSIDADGDGQDDDGVLFGSITTNSTQAAVNVELSGASEAKLDAWIDFDRDGVWEASEKILDDVLVNQSLQTINYNLPSGQTTGDTYARVRLSSAGGLGPTGYADDGEVEDFLLSIVEPPQVEQIVVNNGDAQRSTVDSVQVTFDQVVDIDSAGGNPFSFVHVDSGEVVTSLPVVDDSSGKTVVSFTFDPDGLKVTSAGSLEDGNFRLDIDSSRIRAKDADGTMQSNFTYGTAPTDNFFRLYGDADGNRTVGLLDFAEFRSAFGGPSETFDIDDDGVVSLMEFARFRNSFGKSV